MYRCIELAKRGAGYVAPNPMVGAILVFEGRILGEGFHERYGYSHAEVNCINAVKDDSRKYIARATLYVSLEPCAHFGKTPPCTDLIIDCKIPRVVIGCIDPFREVNGKGIQRLLAAGVEVLVGVLESACLQLNKRFFGFHSKRRPYIILKWAQTMNGKIAGPDRSRVSISNEITNRLVHKWRSEESSILVGSKTAAMDDPALNVRLWTGPEPIRLVIDRDLQLPVHLKLFSMKSGRTIVFNAVKEETRGNISFRRITKNGPVVGQILDLLYLDEVQSILVEGGGRLLSYFIHEKIWDEARIITNSSMQLENGLQAPSLTGARMDRSERMMSDWIQYYSFTG